MLVRLLEAAFDPGEDLDVGRLVRKLAQDKRRLVGYESQLMQGAPVAVEEVQEVRLRIGAYPVCADDSLISHEANY